MHDNPVLETLGRRLRLGVIGGGPGSFIGEIHRSAARLDDRYEVVAGVLSSDPERSVAAGRRIGIDAARAYATAEALFAAEAARDDGIDVVAIMSSNDSHYPASVSALSHGLDVVCEKPLTTSLEDALALVDHVRRTDRVFCVTYNYTGYPMVRQARAMVRTGVIGEIRMVQVEYVQGHNATPVETSRRTWRHDTARAGPSLILGDIGSHAHHLVTYVTGLQLAAVSADVGAVVPERRFDDYAGALLRLENGARGVMWVTQAAAGAEHGLHIRVFGAKGGLEWHQEHPNQLHHAAPGEPVRTLTRAGPGNLEPATRRTRVAIGHPEGFHEAFANLYCDVAEAIIARGQGHKLDRASLDYPTVEDGARGMKFIDAALASSNAGGAWTDCALPGI